MALNMFEASDQQQGVSEGSQYCLAPQVSGCPAGLSLTPTLSVTESEHHLWMNRVKLSGLSEAPAKDTPTATLRPAPEPTSLTENSPLQWLLLSGQVASFPNHPFPVSLCLMLFLPFLSPFTHSTTSSQVKAGCTFPTCWEISAK